MSETPNLGLAFLEAAQAQKHVTVNEALRRLDALVQITVADRDLVAPPASPAEGARYIVAAGANGAWLGKAGQVAAFQDGGWAFLQPRPGWLAYVLDEGKLVLRGASAWMDLPVPAQQLPLLGVLATADAANRLTVKSNGALLSPDDVTPGSGDTRLTVNKKLAANDAGLVLQDGYSTRAIAGLLADDNFVLKVSADGATFKLALAVDRVSGALTLAQSPRFAVALSADLALAANSWTKIGFTTVEHNAQGAYSTANGRFTAPFAGTFRLAASLGYKVSGTAPTALNAAFWRNGAIFARSQRAIAAPLSGKSAVALDEVMALAAGETVEVYGLADGGGALIDAARAMVCGHHIA